MFMGLQERIEQLYATPVQDLDRTEALRTFHEFKFFLNKGEIRSAERRNGRWHVNKWVKQGILLGFRVGVLSDISINQNFRYFEKDTYPLKKISLDQEIRIVPGGTTIRDGAYIGRGVVIMPPAYINVGAYVDDQTAIDSHALVGSCAQVGKRVHISAAAQIGGVLEPIGNLPVIIEDDVMIGGNCGVYEGAIIQQRAVLGTGVILTGSTPVYDLVRGEIYRRTPDKPLTIPEGAVVVQGSRLLSTPFAQEHHLSIYAPLIIKYRDERTDAAIALEESLR
jgi:2,3,4,5-tetrahydropyridine-2-carboxylate N-succinyltransferase